MNAGQHSQRQVSQALYRLSCYRAPKCLDRPLHAGHQGRFAAMSPPSPRRNLHSTPRSLHVHNSQHPFKDCLSCNAKWASETAKSDSELFPTLAKGQAPPILWIGCSDSRVPETTILGMKPGDVFTHRNIANVINPTDVSILSVVEYAVAHLKVKNIVVCGHSSCGGIAAGLGNAKLGVIDVWLQPIRELREKHTEELDKLEGPNKAARLAELNVQHGVEVLKRIPTVIDAIKQRGLKVDGAIYDLASGTLKEVNCDEDDHTATKRIGAFHTE